MKNSVITCGALIVVLSACTSLHVVPFPADPSMPKEWGQYEAKYFDSSQCPDLQGQYLAPVSKVVFENESELEMESGFADYFGLFPWSIASKQPSETSRKESDSDYLRVVQPSDGILVIELQFKSQNESHYYEFREAEKDYYCESGVLRFPERHSFGGIEGASLNGQIRVGLNKTNAGSLIALRTYGIYRSKNYSDHSKFVHEFFRFTSVSNTKDQFQDE